MSDWYVSSTKYATYTAFQINHAYIIGDLIVPTAPALGAKYVLRCTTAGTSAGSEPTWSANNNATTTSNTAVFTNVSGQSTFAWSAAAGDLPSMCGANGFTVRIAAGDRVFLSSDHTETQTSSAAFFGSDNKANGYGVIQFLSVNKAGSTPPVAADLAAGASITMGGAGQTLAISSKIPGYYNGITFTQSSTGATVIALGANVFDSGILYFKNCALNLNTADAGSTIRMANGPVTVILDNTTVQFSHVSQFIQPTYPVDFYWINTPSAIAGATIPTALFNPTSIPALQWTIRGVDLSATTNSLVFSGSFGHKFLFESCKIASGVTRYSLQANKGSGDEIILLNCYDGTNIISERHMVCGDVTTETTITLSGGAQDDVGAFSHKMVSNTNADKFVFPLAGFWIDVNDSQIGGLKTATVEIISSGSLNTDDIALYLEYQGTSSSPVTSFTSSFLATPLSSSSSVAASTATWNSSPSTPQKQKLQTTFTQQTAGRLRAQVRLGKASTTVYYNPQVTIS